MTDRTDAKFLQTSAATAAASRTTALDLMQLVAPSDLDPIFAEIQKKRHDESLKRPANLDSPAIHRRGKTAGHERRLRANHGKCSAKTGFSQVTKGPHRRPGPAFSPRLDAGAPQKRSASLLMYDVKQVESLPEWSLANQWGTPPLVDKARPRPKVVIGRGAGKPERPPKATFPRRVARHSWRRRESSPSISSSWLKAKERNRLTPFPTSSASPRRSGRRKKNAAASSCPHRRKGLRWRKSLSLLAQKVWWSLSLFPAAEKVGAAGPAQRRSLQQQKRALDSPAWHLVEALATLVGPRWQTIPPIRRLRRPKPTQFPPPEEGKMIAEAAKPPQRSQRQKDCSEVDHWVQRRKLAKKQLELLVSRPPR